MTQSRSSSSAGSLSVGNVVSTGFQLYKKNAKQYLSISLAAIGWTLLPLLALIAIGFIAAIIVGATQNSGAGVGIFVLGVIAVIVLGVFCFAKSLVNSALISRLAFGELSRQTEPLESARRFVNSRKWNLLWLQVLMFLIAFGIAMGFYIALAIVGGVLFAVGGGLSGGSNGGIVGLILGLLFVVIVIAAIVGGCWLGAHLFASELPLAIEPQSSATESIGRFWSLTTGNVWRVFGVALVAGLITFPVFLFSQLVSYVMQILVGVLTAQTSQDPSSFAVTGILTVALSLVSVAISLLVNVLVLPFWQVTKAATYFDLRSRREGLGLQLRDR